MNALRGPDFSTLATGGLDGQLKRRAAEQGTSGSKLVEQAVRLFVRTPRTPTAPQAFELVTFGKGGRFSRHNIDKTSALLEADDFARFPGLRWRHPLAAR